MARISAARNVTSSVTWQRNYDPNNAAVLNVVPFAEPAESIGSALRGASLGNAFGAGPKAAEERFSKQRSRWFHDQGTDMQLR